jgi:large subunit ribosomal protein L24e
MPKCTFCGIDIKKGTGKIFIYTSGKIANFCSNKCEKNLLKLKRKPMKTRWTQEWIKENKKVIEKKKAAVAKKEVEQANVAKEQGNELKTKIPVTKTKAESKADEKSNDPSKSIENKGDEK